MAIVPCWAKDPGSSVGRSWEWPTAYTCMRLNEISLLARRLRKEQGQVLRALVWIEDSGKMKMYKGQW